MTSADPTRGTFIDTAEIEPRSPIPGWVGRFVSSQNMTFVYWDVEDGAQAIHEHEHIHIQEEVWHVLEGELEVTIAGVSRKATAGSVAIVPPNTPHSVRALSRSRVIVVDYPIREAFGRPTSE